MKKALSALLCAAMLTTSLSATALAADNRSLPALQLDKPQSFSFQPTAEADQSMGVPCATFTPAKDGWYEFVFDAPFTVSSATSTDVSTATDVTTGTDVATGTNVVSGSTSTSSDENPEIPSFTASICDETDEYFAVQAMTMAFDISSLPELHQKLFKEVFPYPSTLAFTANLYGGTTYIFRCSNESSAVYTSNVTVSAHEHEYTGRFTERSVVSNEWAGTGGIFRRCKTWYCTLYECLEEYPQFDECILSREKFVYDGKAKTPSVTVKTSDGKKMSSDYYTVSYKNNKKVGKATVTLTFQDHYEGTYTRTFKILPTGTKLTKATAKKKAVTLSWKKQATETSGYEIQYATKSNFKGAATITVKGNKATSKAIKNLKAKKTYYFRIRTFKTVNGKKYASAWSGTKSVKVK